MESDSTRSTIDIVVAVLTFHRPGPLRTLLDLLPAQLSDAGTLGFATRVVVVDNDAAESSRAVVADARCDAHYVVEQKPGISAARNRALATAYELDARVLVFIDDDEEPCELWLSRLLATYRATGAAAVAGRVESRVVGGADPWLVAGGFYERAHRRGLRTGDAIESAATNNLLLDLRVVRRLDLWFDDARGATGGEDTRFTLALAQAGERLVWCDDAVVVDVVPPDRATRRAALRRVYASAGSSIAAILAATSPGTPRLILAVRFCATSLGRITGGAGLLIAGTVSRRTSWQARGARLIARGLGALSGVRGRVYAEYGRTSSV